jgi:hypothetical protein
MPKPQLARNRRARGSVRVRSDPILDEVFLLLQSLFGTSHTGDSCIVFNERGDVPREDALAVFLHGLSDSLLRALGDIESRDATRARMYVVLVLRQVALGEILATDDQNELEAGLVGLEVTLNIEELHRQGLVRLEGTFPGSTSELWNPEYDGYRAFPLPVGVKP